MIDIHNHILPGLDDGSQDIETTEIYLDLIAKANMEAIVFTPHFKRGFFDNTKDKILEAFHQVESLIIAKNYSFKVYCAAEVYLVGELAVTDIQNNSFMINGSRYILVENSIYGFSKDLYENLYSLVKLGYKPILAHPERYSEIQKNIDLAADFLHRDIYLQINTGSLLDSYNMKTKETALELINRGYAHFLGTDSHCHTDVYDFPLALDIIKKQFGNDIAHILSKENPEKMINNDDVPYFYMQTKPRQTKKNIFQKIFGLKIIP